MPKKAMIIGIPLLGLLLAGLVLFGNQEKEAEVSPDLSTRIVERPGIETGSGKPVVRARWNFDQTLVYRFEVKGALTVQPPAESKKSPVPARFTLNGDLAIGPGAESGTLLCQFRDISVKGSSTSVEKARKSLEGRTARVSISDRGEIQSVSGDDQVAVFLSHFEFVLPAGEESEWRQEGRDPAGSFVSIYRLGGGNQDEERLVMKLEKEKEYTAEPSNTGGITFLPRYSSTGYFDVANGRMSQVEISGLIPESDRQGGVSMKGRVEISFLFDRVETSTIVEVQPVREGAGNSPVASKKKPRPPKITFADISPNLYSPDSNLRSRALLQLTHVKGPEALQVLMEAIQDGDFRIRAAAAQSLAAYRSEGKPLGKLLEMLKTDSNPLVRYRVAGALRGSASPEAREILATVAEGDSSKFVRKAANAALAYPTEGGIDAH